ncbi:hypothetical protein VTN31DRAFT_1375 [Thermomyces dupontii]|uniref:uncharacterized protein n=1 Tax=Talaromyces thermophilus TaxID=28565 RepID=UPI003742F57F
MSPTKRTVRPRADSSPHRKAALPVREDDSLRDQLQLRRTHSARAATRPSTRDGAASRASDGQYGYNRDLSPATDDRVSRPKSFSERIAESRAAERIRQERTRRIQQSRSTAFAVDRAELDRFKEEAAARPALRTESPVRSLRTESFSRDEVLRAAGGEQTSKSKTSSRPQRDNTGDVEGEGETDLSTFEPFSALHLSKRILPHSFLRRTLEGKTVLRIPELLRTVKAPAFELPEIEGDYVVVGIVASKSEPRQHQQRKKHSATSTAENEGSFDDGLNNRDKYMVLTLTDLTWELDLFLFDTAFPRYYKLGPGTVVAILNPSILPPSPGRIDTNRFSLSLASSDDTVLEVGTARDIGYCRAERRDGRVCNAWIDVRKTEFCDFHVDLQIRRTQAQRLAVNGATTGQFAPGGRTAGRIADMGPPSRPRRRAANGLKPEGAQWDSMTGSTYYIAPAPRRASPSSSPTRIRSNTGSSAAELIDRIDDNPFSAGAGGGISVHESKEDRLRRRLITQQREHEIAAQLGARSKSTGAEYLRARTLLAQQREHQQSEQEPKRHSSSSSSFSAQQQQQTQTAATTTPSSRAAGAVRRIDALMDRYATAANTKPSAPTSPSLKRARTVVEEEEEEGEEGRRRRTAAGDTTTTTTPMKKTRFITSKGIREAGRESFGVGSDPSLSSEGKKGRTGNDYHDDYDDDDELEII